MATFGVGISSSSSCRAGATLYATDRWLRRAVYQGTHRQPPMSNLLRDVCSQARREEKQPTYGSVCLYLLCLNSHASQQSFSPASMYVVLPCASVCVHADKPGSEEPHYHLYQEEHIKVKQGKLGYFIGHQTHVQSAEVDQEVTIKPGGAGGLGVQRILSLSRCFGVFCKSRCNAHAGQGLKTADTLAGVAACSQGGWWWLWWCI